MKILFVGAEAMPFAASGGLGDVMGSLPAALQATGEADVRVMLPLYAAVGEEWRAQMKREVVLEVPLAWRRQYCGVYSLTRDGVTYYFLDNEYYFKREGLYGHYDDGERFAFFCMAALCALEGLDFYPDVLHAHDWQAALAVVYLRTVFSGKQKYDGIRSVFTIHNIAYQGRFSHGILGDVFALDGREAPRLDFDGDINLMKGAIVTADRISTVSPRYAEEICSPTHAHGLDGILRENAHKLCGILNGIDYHYYDPAHDPVLYRRYTADAPAAKAENKRALQQELGLEIRGDVPLFALVTRLASHKGLELLEGMAHRLLQRDVQLVVLGCGEARFEAFFRHLEAENPTRVRACLRYDRTLSRRIYAAADLFLMPSQSEPCGLAQMIACRYGAIPIVRAVGGLYDSIKPYHRTGHGVEGNGFTFTEYSADALLLAAETALEVFADPAHREELRAKVMREDFSWRRSARQYLAMYRTL